MATVANNTKRNRAGLRGPAWGAAFGCQQAKPKGRCGSLGASTRVPSFHRPALIPAEPMVFSFPPQQWLGLPGGAGSPVPASPSRAATFIPGGKGRCRPHSLRGDWCVFAHASPPPAAETFSLRRLGHSPMQGSICLNE